MTWLEALEALDPCPQGLAFARQHDTLESAWAACPNGWWMCWLLIRIRQATGTQLQSYPSIQALWLRWSEAIAKIMVCPS